MATWSVKLIWVCLLVAATSVVGLRDASSSAGGGGGGGTRRKGRGGRGGVAAFRQQHDNVDLTHIDPLFTDQRQIPVNIKDLLPATGEEAPVRPDHDVIVSRKKKRKNSAGSSYNEDYVGYKKKPNIILFLTDDQDVELGSLEFMPKTRSILKDNGAFFPNAYVSTPMCCPSRSSLLTGLFVHNHGVLTNNNNCSSAHWQAEHEPRTFGAYLASAGYRTGYFGKYLNKYNGSYIPPGWREWAGLVMNSRFYNYTVNFNGRKIKHGFDYHLDYYTDLITNDSVNFLRQSKKEYDKQPFLLVMSYPAPHGPEDSAPKYSDMFFNVTRHRTPSYDFAPNPDKQWILRWISKMEPLHHKFTDLLMTKRLQTLQSVDESVERIYNELKAMGELDNTYMFYTSDHGYHLGQFGLIKGKSFPFEFDVRVPFLVRGPGVGSSRVIHDLIGNVDLAPTFLEIAGVPIPPHMDGASFYRFLHKKKTKSLTPWRDTYLLERGKYPPPPGSTYKLNVLEDVPKTANEEGAEGDDGDSLPVEYAPPRGKFERLAVECQKPQYQSPCSPYQKYECVFVNDRWKMKKCRHDYVLKRKWCKCKALSKYRLSKLEPHERKMQRAFLKEHLGVEWHGYKPRFLKTVIGKGKRSKRSSDVELDESKSSVLRDVAEDEIEEVDIIIENISEELSDLEALRVSNLTKGILPAAVSPAPPPQFLETKEDKLNCHVLGQNRINCSSEVYSDPLQWKLSKEYLDRQIRTLRTQLDELKVIRKHLREMRPPEVTAEEDLTPAGEQEDEITTPAPRRRKIKKGFRTTTTVAPVLEHAEESTELNGYPVIQEDTHAENNTTVLLDNNAVLSQETGLTDDEEQQIRHPQRNFKRPAKNSATTGRIDVVVYDTPRYKPRGGSGLCPCDENWTRRKYVSEEQELRQALRRKLKEERLKRKSKKLRRKQDKASRNGQCNLDQMNCFSHDNDHWRTSPLWTDGPFCVCMNANNNTYWCIRTLNATHNSLYCEFITGFVTYFDMKIDPYQLRNIAHTLTETQLAFFHQLLEHMRTCKGSQCFLNTGHKDRTVGSKREALTQDPVQVEQHSSYAFQSSSRKFKTANKRQRFWKRHKWRTGSKNSGHS